MFIEFLKSFLFKDSCSHQNFDHTGANPFCPDCGKEVQVTFKIVRCSCCSTKKSAKLIFKRIIPDEKYCSKCGSKNYFVEKKERIEFFDLKYAIILKEIVEDSSFEHLRTQIWIENENNWSNIIKPKLIPSFPK